jgi:hypothetical protein
MEKYEALEVIKEAWDNNNLSLEEKIITISDAFYSVGLDIATTANYIKATPAEFDVFLSLSNLDDRIIKEISKANPPKTTWLLLASGNEDEIKKGLAALSNSSELKNESVCEFIYQQMIEVAGDTPEQKISQLSGDELFYLANKAKNFSMSDKELKFLNSVAGQKKRGKVLSDKQIGVLITIFHSLADNKVIQRDSIDGDSELCDKILDAIDR